MLEHMSLFALEKFIVSQAGHATWLACDFNSEFGSPARMLDQAKVRPSLCTEIKNLIAQYEFYNCKEVDYVVFNCRARSQLQN